MPYYKSPDNKIHFLDSTEFEHFLPTGSLPITDDIAAALVANTAMTPAELVMQQIASLEISVTPRRLREATLTAAGKTWLKDIDSQIAALRLTLTQ